jgi:hypothetical protein
MSNGLESMMLSGGASLRTDDSDRCPSPGERQTLPNLNRMSKLLSIDDG